MLLYLKKQLQIQRVPREGMNLFISKFYPASLEKGKMHYDRK